MGHLQCIVTFHLGQVRSLVPASHMQDHICFIGPKHLIFFLLFQFLSEEHRTSKSGMLNKPVQRLPPNYARSPSGVVPATLPFTGWEPHLNLRQHSTGNLTSLLYSVIWSHECQTSQPLSAADVSHLAFGISVDMDLWKSLFLIIAVGIHPRHGTWVSCVCQLSWSIIATWRIRWRKCPRLYSSSY